MSAYDRGIKHNYSHESRLSEYQVEIKYQLVNLYAIFCELR
jgi:hypothetical protein